MAAGVLNIYAKNKNHINTADLVAAGSIKILLTTSAYVPDITVTGHSVLADVTNELASANGYTTGGAALTTPASATTGTTGYKLTGTGPVWTASGGSIPAWRNAVLYYVGSLWGLTSPLIGYFLGDATPADVPATTSGNTLTINMNANGWFDVT